MKRRVLFVCPYPQNVAPSQRLKFEQYYKCFREADYEVEVSSFIDRAFWQIIYKKGNLFRKVLYTSLGYLKRIFFLFRLGQYDIVYVHLWVTPFGPPVFEWLYRKLAKSMVYDIDDLVYLSDVKSRAHPVVTMIKGRNKPFFLMRCSNHVITCTPYLDNFVRRFNQNTTDISSTINTSLYQPKTGYSINGKAVIGWSGSHSTAKYLHLLDEVFQALAKTHSFKLVVMGDPGFHVDGVEVEALEWKETYEVDVIRSFDIGVYPLPDEEWILGKSGLKALQYMALGVPTVASALGTIFRIIEDEENGYLVSTTEEWVQRLGSLIDDQQLRKKLGNAAVNTVREQYSIEANKGKYLAILEGL